MSEDRCICCGDIVPEGRMVCPQCIKMVKEMPLDLTYESPAVVMIIRCRECRWYSKEQGVCFHPHSNRLYVSEDFYCAEGKRREKTDAEIH